MSHATISFVVLGSAVALFVLNRSAPEIVALAAALALYVTGVPATPSTCRSANG